MCAFAKVFLNWKKKVKCIISTCSQEALGFPIFYELAVGKITQHLFLSVEKYVRTSRRGQKLTFF